jgi:hypothetical protein
MANWSEVLQQIQALQAQGQQLQARATDIVRHNYLKALHEKTGRNVIAYYSGFLSKQIGGIEINDEDKNGFMMAVHKLDRSKGLDLIIHTPGGNISSTQSIVDYLHKMFAKNVRAIVPQIAMSAGTMLACSCKEIWMGKHSNLGPIDPHINGIPAYGVLSEFREACKQVKQDPSKIPIWQSIIGQYRPTFLSRCENAIEWSNSFVRQQLAEIMFAGQPNAKEKADAIVKRLTDFTENKTHERHIHCEECLEMGLNVKSIENDKSSDKDFQDLVLTVHHCYMHVFMNTRSYKAIENHIGGGIFKQLTA